MRILVAHNYLRPPSGENTVFEEETAMLESHGHTVERFVLRNEELDQWSLLRKALIPFRVFWSVSTYRRFAQRIREFRPDVVHFHNVFPLISPACYHAAKRAGVPVVQTLHHFRFVCPGAMLFRDGRVCEDCRAMRFGPGIWHGCYRGSRLQTAGIAAAVYLHYLFGTWSRCIDGYIALSSFAQDKFQALGLPARRFFVKPNFLNIDLRQSGDREAWGVCIGRVGEEKGIRSLVAALRRASDVQVKIVGDGPLRGYLTAELAKEGLENVEYLGMLPRDRCLELLWRARFLVFPSVWYEGMPMVVLEAMAGGTPVVASRIGALPDLVEHEVTGLLVTPGSVEELSTAMGRLAADPERSLAMGARGQELFRERFTADANHAQLVRIYQQVIDGAREG